MNNFKSGKSIVNFVKKMSSEGNIDDYKINIDDDGYIDIKIKINNDYSLRTYPTYSASTGKFTEWDIESIQDGHSMYYSSCKTQKQVIDTLEERILYSNRAYRNKLGEKYRGIGIEDLIKVIVHRDIEIDKLYKDIGTMSNIIDDRS